MTDKDLLVFERRKKKIKLWQIAEKIQCSISLLSRFERENINMDTDKITAYKNFIKNY